MSPSIRRLLLLTAGVGLVATVLQSVPAATASVAPWTWKRVTMQISVQPTTSYGERALCPSGFTAITGGLQLPTTSQIKPQGEYRQDDASGSGWTVLFRNDSASTGTATVVAECVETTDLPPISYNIQVFDRNASGYAWGDATCPNAGEVVLTGGVDWSNTSTGRNITASVPGSGQTSWYGRGSNPVSGAQLAVEVYCVDPAYLPGLQQIETTRTGGGYFQETLTCPQGKRILNGGNVDYVNGSSPNITTWTGTFLHYTDATATTIRALCINAGSPTVSIDFASPGPPGTVTLSSLATFQFSGADPAGYPNSFKCSLDGKATTSCGQSFETNFLPTGSHQLVVWNTTVDGRTSGAATYQWTVDQIPPTVTKPKLSKVTLTSSTTAKWSGSDEGSSVNHYAGAYNLFHTDGTATGWTQPLNWAALTSPELKTPDLAPGESVCVAVRAFDQANDASAWSAPGCTTRPFDDRALTATAGWTRATGSAYWQNTVSRTTALSETLTRNSVSLSRVGVLATVCPGCGSVIVKVGATKIGRINLDAATRADRTVKLLPVFGGQTGDVTLKSTTTGQQISIDGLVAMQGTSTGPA